MRLKPLATTLACAALFAAGTASATALSGAMTVDNEFTLYISTNDSLLGTALLSGSDWQTTSVLPGTTLGSAATYYLHVVATDWGGPAAFIGDFSLDDAETYALMLAGLGVLGAVARKRRAR